MDFSFILNFYSEMGALAHRYGVSPKTFFIIYALMTPTYYFGVYIMGRVGLNYRKACKEVRKGMNLHDLFLKKGFLEGYAINRLSWAAPYIYVIIWGRGLPIRFYFLLSVWFILGIYFFTHKIKKKYIGGVRHSNLG